MTNIKANDVVAGINWHTLFDEKEMKHHKLTKNGVVWFRYESDIRTFAPRVYKVIKVEGNIATCQSAFIDRCDGDEALSWRSSTKGYYFDIEVKHLYPISYFTKKCLCLMLTDIIGINGITKESISILKTHKELVSTFTSGYNVLYDLAKEKTDKQLKWYDEHLKEKQSRAFFEKLKAEIIELISEIEFTKENEMYLEMARWSLIHNKKHFKNNMKSTVCSFVERQP